MLYAGSAHSHWLPARVGTGGAPALWLLGCDWGEGDVPSLRGLAAEVPGPLQG